MRHPVCGLKPLRAESAGHQIRRKTFSEAADHIRDLRGYLPGEIQAVIKTFELIQMVAQIPGVFLVEPARGHDVLGHKDVLVLEMADDGRDGGIVPEGLRHAVNKHVCDSVQSRDDDNMASSSLRNQGKYILDVPFSFQRTAANLDHFHIDLSSQSYSSRPRSGGKVILLPESR